MSGEKRLPKPEDASYGSNSAEILSVWLSDGAPHYTFLPNVWDDPSGWGILLSDLMKDIARAYAINSHQNVSDVLARIHEGFNAEQ